MLRTLGEITLTNSFKNLNFPTSLWNLLPQFFMQASRTYNKPRYIDINCDTLCKRTSKWKNKTKTIQWNDGTLHTVNACIASHSWGDWILWTNSLTDICGLKNMTERNYPNKNSRTNTIQCLGYNRLYNKLNAFTTTRKHMSNIRCWWFNIMGETRLIETMWPYPSSSLLTWSQNAIIYSQSSCLLEGLVALSENEKDMILSMDSPKTGYPVPGKLPKAGLLTKI